MRSSTHVSVISMLGGLRAIPGGALCALALAAAPLTPQDLQPGRNFPVSAAAFGTDRSADIDSGDADNDGDLDVLVGNGMDGPAQANRIFINLGGLQGGATGDFADETAVRFAGAVIERTRDIAFVDIDGDSDLDVFEASDGSLAVGGGVQRFYTNQGGLQGGTIGFWTDSSNTSWGTLISVPLAQQVLGGNAGPWRGFGWDSDFADLDLDGDLDLFWTTMGNGFAGNADSLLFLNDGNGVYDEFYPWADAAADIKMHGIDSSLVDFDDDFDIDIFVGSGVSQSRVFLNNLNGPLGASPFQDVTQSALLDTGASQIGGSVYESEAFDADGDGDFDLWMTNYVNFLDRVLRNDGVGASGSVTFRSEPLWIASDPNIDEQGGDPLDYDGDGDLDFASANFSGTNWLYRNSLAQGGAVAPLFRRTGMAAEAPEMPATDNTATTLDAECADVDGDGDADILFANDANQQNRLLLNVLGVPDTHAPTFHRVEGVADKPAGPDARVIAQVRDNEPVYGVSRAVTRLSWSVDLGPEESSAMRAQGGQQFMGFVPGAAAGLIRYRVECTDSAGNTGLSATQTFYQGVANPWTDLGFAKAGVNGPPLLTGLGTLLAGAPGTLDLSGAAPAAQVFVYVSTTAGFVPFKDGKLVPFPVPLTLSLMTAGDGAVSLPFVRPVAVPPGMVLVMQAWIEDGSGTLGAAASNGLQALLP